MKRPQSDLAALLALCCALLCPSHAVSEDEMVDGNPKEFLVLESWVEGQKGAARFGPGWRSTDWPDIAQAVLLSGEALPSGSLRVSAVTPVIHGSYVARLLAEPGIVATGSLHLLGRVYLSEQMLPSHVEVPEYPDLWRDVPLYVPSQKFLTLDGLPQIDEAVVNSQPLFEWMLVQGGLRGAFTEEHNLTPKPRTAADGSTWLRWQGKVPRVELIDLETYYERHTQLRMTAFSGRAEWFAKFAPDGSFKEASLSFLGRLEPAEDGSDARPLASVVRLEMRLRPERLTRLTDASVVLQRADDDQKPDVTLHQYVPETYSAKGCLLLPGSARAGEPPVIAFAVETRCAVDSNDLSKVLSAGLKPTDLRIWWNGTPFPGEAGADDSPPFRVVPR